MKLWLIIVTDESFHGILRSKLDALFLVVSTELLKVKSQSVCQFVRFINDAQKMPQNMRCDKIGFFSLLIRTANYSVLQEAN